MPIIIALNIIYLQNIFLVNVFPIFQFWKIYNINQKHNKTHNEQCDAYFLHGASSVWKSMRLFKDN